MIRDAFWFGVRFLSPWPRATAERIDHYGPLDQIVLQALYCGLGNARVGAVSRPLSDPGTGKTGNPEPWLRLFIAACKGAAYDREWLGANQ